MLNEIEHWARGESLTFKFKWLTYLLINFKCQGVSALLTVNHKTHVLIFVPRTIKIIVNSLSS